MQSVIKEFKGMTDQLVFTNDHLFLAFGRDPSARYIVDLMVHEHQFFVRYLDADNPLLAAYLPNGDKEGAIEVETFVIDQLQSLGFIWKTEIFDDEVESTRAINHPQDCLIIIDMSKTMSGVEEP